MSDPWMTLCMILAVLAGVAIGLLVVAIGCAEDYRRELLAHRAQVELNRRRAESRALVNHRSRP